MKFTLKPYQRTALEDMLVALDRAKTIHEREATPTSVSLSATTGAGKTVIASAVIESLFYGNDDFDFEQDDGAVVIWFSDDPNLNEQTRFRIMEASDKIVFTDLVTITAPFSKPKLEAGKVYFLNTQKLSKSSLLTRGHEVAAEEDVLEGMHHSAQPDMQGYTIWQTIANTIDDPDLTLYLIIDEAHRGFGASAKATREKSTIVQRLINGHAGYPPVSIVWGISATIGDFRQAMDNADVSGDRRYLPAVQVDGFAVQESGLVKDVVKVDIPAEAQAIDMVLVRRAAKKLKHSSERWKTYCDIQGLPDVVQPLMVLQAPNTPDHDKLGEALDVIFEELPELGSESVRHVLGEHSMQTFGAYQVDWIEPQVVEDRTHVRVLIAKDAIYTGWDCPRAEVLVSFRPARDHDHIQQLLGRMVRTPLARRVPGDDELNSVDCLLPFFDRKTAGDVVKLLTAQIDGVPESTRKMVREECVMTPNKAVPDIVWHVWDNLPSMTIPQRGTSPVKRLAALALTLSTDGVRHDALAEIAQQIHTVLDESAEQYKKRVKAATAEVLAVRLQEISAKFGAKGVEYTDIVEQADDRAIRAAFEDARKAFGADIAMGYVDHLTVDDDSDDALRDAFVRAAALACVPEVREAVDTESDHIAEELFDAHAEAIKELPDDCQQEYRDINALAATPQIDLIGRPRTRIEDYVEEHSDGQLGRAELVSLHLMSDEDGYAPITKLNDWEGEIVKHEIARPGALGWYRNPPRQTADSLGIAYRDETTGNWRSMHPDFIFFHDVDGEARASIVDPHGHHLEDSLVKLQALATFAEDHGEAFHRIEALSKVGDVMKVLDLKDDDVRAGVHAGGHTVDWFYNSPLATNYYAEH